jgi:ABC-type nitrate/sulfonate/bicarbonate transport system ATPase subunit
LKVRLLRDGAPVVIDLVAEKGRGRFDEFGFVFQNSHLLRNATGVMNITAAFTASGLARPLGDVLDQAAAVKLLPELLVKRARQLSGGEKQRTAIGRGIARHPQILFADEPTANLDPRNGLSIMGHICHWQRQGNGERTVIWVTHNILEVSVFADEIILLEPPPTGISDKVGRLMQPKPGWQVPTRGISGTAAPENAPENVWPMRNPHDPRVLASMLFAAEVVAPPSQQSAELLQGIRSQFVESEEGAAAVDQELLSAAIAVSALGVAVRAGESVDTIEPAPAPAAAQTSGIQLTPQELKVARATPVGRWSVSRIGIAELFSESKADSDAQDVPRPASKLVGIPNALVDITIDRQLVGRRRRATNQLLLALGALGAVVLISPRYWQIEPVWGVPAIGMAIMVLPAMQLLRHGAANALWLFRAYGRRFQSTILLAIAVFLYALVLARDAVQSSFDASLRSLELSHVVVALRSSGGKLNQKRIDDDDKNLKLFIEKDAGAFDRSWRSQWIYEPTKAAGRWLWDKMPWIERQTQPTVSGATQASEGRLVFGRWLLEKKMVQWPLIELTQPDDMSPERACQGTAPPVRFSDAAILSIDTAEPAMEQLRYLQGATLSELAPIAKPPPADAMRRAMDLNDNDNLMGVIVSNRLIERLHARRPEGSDPRAKLAKHLCMFGPEGSWQLARIVGIVDALPKEQLVEAVHVMIPHALFEHVYKSKFGETDALPNYDSEAFYFKDPRLIDTYKKHLRGKLDDGTVLPDAFNQIQKGLETSKTLTDLVSYILYGIIGFAMLLVGLLTSGFITQNEQSLCVLRAFGVRLPHIIWLVGLQMFIIWGIALILAFVIVWLAAPKVEATIIQQMGLTTRGLRGTMTDWYEMVVLMTLSVLTASAIASTSWWLSTPNVGDRLKELD